MSTVAQVVTLVLAITGTITSAVALWVQRRNARDATMASVAAREASSKTDQQTLAHTELVDALKAMGELVDRYRQQIDDTRRQLGRHEKQMVAMQAELMESKEEHKQCKNQLAVQANQLRIAEARIAELGG